MRDLIENDIILSLFSKILGTENQDGLLYAAIKDRIKDKCHMGVKNIVKAIIFDMIRESGDRGTLVGTFVEPLIEAGKGFRVP